MLKTRAVCALAGRTRSLHLHDRETEESSAPVIVHLRFRPSCVLTSPAIDGGNGCLQGTANSNGFFRGVPMPATLEIYDATRVGKRPLFTTHEELLEEESYDEQAPEKKRRLTLTAEQVELLERSFEEENKLEPERNTELARGLGMTPRQVAVWFQNRRTRWKTKQLDKEYARLKDAYDALLIDKYSLREFFSCVQMGLYFWYRKPRPAKNNAMLPTTTTGAVQVQGQMIELAPNTVAILSVSPIPIVGVHKIEVVEQQHKDAAETRRMAAANPDGAMPEVIEIVPAVVAV